MTRTRTPLRRRRPVLTTLLLLAAHGVAVVVLVMLALSVALAIGGPTVGRDELYRMGPALQLAVAGAVLPFGVAVLLASLVGLAAPRRAWLVPTFGICTSVVFCVAAMLFLHPPAPLPGG